MSFPFLTLSLCDHTHNTLAHLQVFPVIQTAQPPWSLTAGIFSGVRTNQGQTRLPSPFNSSILGTKLSEQ